MSEVKARTEPAQQNVDAMIEADREAEWERMVAERAIEKMENDSLKNLVDALKELDKTTDSLVDVVDALEGMPIADRIEAIRYDLDNIWCDLNGIKKEFERRVRG